MKIRKFLSYAAVVAVLAVSTVGCASSRGQGKSKTGPDGPGKKDTVPTPVAIAESSTVQFLI